MPFNFDLDGRNVSVFVFKMVLACIIASGDGQPCAKYRNGVWSSWNGTGAVKYPYIVALPQPRTVRPIQSRIEMAEVAIRYENAD